MDQKKKLAELCRFEEVAISAYGDFVGHGYMQHGKCGWCGSHSVRHHSHPIPSNYDLKDPIVFAYGANFAVAKKTGTGFLKKTPSRM